jgi:hypothetical protein
LLLSNFPHILHHGQARGVAAARSFADIKLTIMKKNILHLNTVKEKGEVQSNRKLGMQPGLSAWLKY